MLALETVHDVTRVHLWTRLGRLLGYTVSAYVTRGVLVDTGFPLAADDLRTAIQRLRPTLAVVTHAHEDHGGNAALLASLGLPVVAGAATLAALRQSVRLPLYRRAVWGTPRPLPPHCGTDDDTLLRAVGLRLLEAPGHARDHTVVWDDVRGHLFGGDLFLGVKVRVAQPDEEPRRLVESLRWAAALEPAVLFDAHRGPLARPAALLRAKADWLESVITAVQELAARGLSERAIRRRVLGSEAWIAFGSAGEYRKLNLVRAARAGRR